MSDCDYDDIMTPAMLEAEIQRNTERKKRIEEQESSINLVIHSVNIIFSHEGKIADPFINSLINVINNNPSLEKKYKVARAIDSVIDSIIAKLVDGKHQTEEERERTGNEIRAQIKKRLEESVFDITSLLYNALNSQRSLIPITFFGKKKWLSFNYSRALQDVQDIVDDKRADNSHRWF